MRIGILTLGQIGDALLSTSIHCRLRDAYPDAEIVAVASPANVDIFRAVGVIDSTYVIRNGPGGVVDALRLASRRFSIWVDPKSHRSTTSRLLLELLRYDLALSVVENAPLFGSVDIIPPSEDLHFVEGIRLVLDMLDLSGSTEILRPCLENLASTTQTPAAETLLVNISARTSERYWQDKNWRELLQRISTSDETEVLVVSSPEDRHRAESIAQVVPGARVVDTPRIDDLVPIVARSDVAITPDTSIVHMAAAFDVPVVGLYPPSDHNLKRFAPLSTHNRVVRSRSVEDLSSITVDDVIGALDELRREVGDQKSEPIDRK